MTLRGVREYYDSFGEREWERLERTHDGALEFAVTTHAIAARLPPHSRVLDIGGGPGRHTIWLAENGHRITLADLSPVQLRIAERKIAEAGVAHLMEEIAEADARDLSRWPDGSFDAALALGPFYHLPDPTDRDRAASELARVLRPGSVALVALMPRYAFLRRTIALPDERRHLLQPGFLQALLERGEFHNDVPGRFTGGYGVRPQEVEPFFTGHGFEKLDLLAVEGILPDLQGELAEMAAEDPKLHRAALEVVFGTAGDPSILGLSNHLLYVGVKRG